MPERSGAGTVDGCAGFLLSPSSSPCWSWPLSPAAWWSCSC